MEFFLELSCWCFGTFKKVMRFCLCNSNVFGRLHEQLAKKTWFRKWNRNVFINLKRDKFIANAIQCVHFNIHVWFYFNSFSISQTLWSIAKILYIHRKMFKNRILIIWCECQATIVVTLFFHQWQNPFISHLLDDFSGLSFHEWHSYCSKNKNDDSLKNPHA